MMNGNAAQSDTFEKIMQDFLTWAQKESSFVIWGFFGDVKIGREEFLTLVFNNERYEKIYYKVLKILEDRRRAMKLSGKYNNRVLRDTNAFYTRKYQKTLKAQYQVNNKE